MSILRIYSSIALSRVISAYIAAADLLPNIIAYILQGSMLSQNAASRHIRCMSSIYFANLTGRAPVRIAMG